MLNWVSRFATWILQPRVTSFNFKMAPLSERFCARETFIFTRIFMSRNSMTNQITAVVLAFLLLLTPTLAVSKNGKKYFKEGLRLEVSEKWDQAAEQFSLALNEEP